MATFSKSYFDSIHTPYLRRFLSIVQKWVKNVKKDQINQVLLCPNKYERFTRKQFQYLPMTS